MNIGIITTSKNINCSKLPNNTYLAFYINKRELKISVLNNIINYLILNKCKTIMVDANINRLIKNHDYKNINIVNSPLDIMGTANDIKIITYNFNIKNKKAIFYEKCATSRKDKNPNDTVRTIKKILKNNNYHVTEKGLKKSLNGSYSIRLELNNGKGSNGKGTSLAFAKASAYAELIERIQSNMLNKKRIETGKINKSHYVYKSLLAFSSSKYKKEFFNLNEIYFNLSEAFNIKTNKKESIPVNAICSFCHTNGLASGNTFSEAINQAIFEILERFCYQQYLKGVDEMKNIDISAYPLSKNNRKMLKKLESMGFIYYVKDCSLGKYPVIGFLLFDKDQKKYTFTMGADVSFNIALSRCITEMMQGVNFKELKRKMVSNTSVENLTKMYGKSFSSYNWLRCFNNNNGYLTNNFFGNSYISITKLHFKDYLTTNEDVLNYLKSLIKKNIYVVDYNSLGFDTYRVYIPYMTSVDCYDIEDLIVNKNYDKLKHTYTNILTVSDEEVTYFINIFLKNSRLLKYDEMIKPSELFHVNEISDYYKLDFTSLLIVLCIKYSRTSELNQLLQYKIKNFPLSSDKMLTYQIVINCILKYDYYKVKNEHIYQYIQKIINNPEQYLMNLKPEFVNNNLLIYNKKA